MVYTTHCLNLTRSLTPPFEGLLVELSQDLVQDVVRMQKQPANTRGCFKINLFCWKNDPGTQSLYIIQFHTHTVVTLPTSICCEITLL